MHLGRISDGFSFLRRPLFRRASVTLVARSCRHDTLGPMPHSEWHARPIGVTETFGDCPPGNYGRPIRARISAGLAPAARSSRKPVAPVDLESLCPAASRISW